MNEKAQELLSDAESSVSMFLEKVNLDIAAIYFDSFEFYKKIQFTEVFKASHDYKDDNNSFVYVGNLDNRYKLKFSPTYVEDYATYTLCNVYKSSYDMRFIYWYLSCIEEDVGEMYFHDRASMFNKIELVRIPVVSIDTQLEIITKINKLKSIGESINESLNTCNQIYD